jgi:hypothetical protein
MQAAPTPSRRRIAKPPGVIILTAFDGIAVGLVPLAALLFLDNISEGAVTGPEYYLSAFFHIVVVAAALGAFMGENFGRIVLLWAVTAISVLMIINGFSLIGDEEVRRSARLRQFGSITRGLFWIGINWWYLNRKGIVAFYKQDHQEGDQVARG